MGKQPFRWIVDITGATRTIFGVRLLQVLQGMKVEAHVVLSNWGRAHLDPPDPILRGAGLTNVGAPLCVSGSGRGHLQRFFSGYWHGARFESANLVGRNHDTPDPRVNEVKNAHLYFEVLVSLPQHSGR
jgi:hypothetical protein